MGQVLIKAASALRPRIGGPTTQSVGVKKSGLQRLLIGLVALSLCVDLTTLAATFHTRSAHAGLPLYEFGMEAAVGGIALIAVTLLMVLKVPEHPITWLMVASGMSGSLQQVFGSLAVESLGAGHLAGGTVLLALSSLFQSWWVMLFLLLVILFPTGRPLQGWLGRVVWLIPMLMLIAAHDAFTSPLTLWEDGDTFPAVLESVRLPEFLDFLGLVTVVGVVAHVVVRYVRSRGVERQQLKWFVFTFVSGVALIAFPWSENEMVGTVLWTLVPAAVVMSIALAVIRYRLYEIDKVISRTVSYALVAGLLGLAYFAVIASGARFLASNDPLVVAVATLTAAALFSPLRRKVQGSVDRRFNRSRYDSESVVAEFGGVLRDRVDAESIVDGWVGVVERTLAPSIASVWVRTSDP